MDCEPHHVTCPIAAENARQERMSGESSPSSSPDNTASASNINSNNNNSNNNRTTGTRKSLRSGRKSPQEVLQETQRRRLQFCALCEVEKHVRKVHDSTLRDKPVAPSTFVDGFIDFVAPWFKPGVQEDSHEFLRLLIDSMQKSCEKARPRVQGVSASALAVQQDNPQDDSPTSSPVAAAAADKDSEYPFSLFRGTVESIVTCESCGASSSTLDPIEDIGLEVTSGSASTSTMTSERMSSTSSRNNSPTPFTPALADVQTAFQRFARAEPLDAGYKCEKCGLVGRATKQSRLASIPPILTLHLKRFRYGTAADHHAASMMMMNNSSSAASSSCVTCVSDANNNNNNNSNNNFASTVATRRTPRSEVGQLLGSTHSDFKSGSAKIEGNIKFQELFDLKPYLTDELQAQHCKTGMLCRLFAVIVHAGKNSHSGHYIAYVRSLNKAATSNECWWKMDDGRVTPATPQEGMCV
jgi:ubiquitin C-terminal hydrolase